MAIDYNDRRFAQVEQEKTEALNKVNDLYNNMISNSDKFYQDQINASKEYATTQQQNQQAQTDFIIEKIEQQKEQTGKDYLKEQKGAYTDYKKASNQYGANAEALASQGMSNTGYAESSLVSMYNQYQTRVSNARDTYNKALLNYDNGIKEAKLQNNSVLAEIAFKSLQQQLEIGLAGFQYKNTLLQQQLAQQNETEDRYYSRWQDVQSQINTENALAEQIRQFNINQSNWEREFALAQRNSYGGGGNNGGGNDGDGNNINQPESNKKGKLSAKAQTLMNKMVSLKPKNSKNKTTKKASLDAWKDATKTQLAKANITNEEKAYIYKQLGL